jgi:hypothetical protein|tara:strand:+ start:36 stop:704 length:669 start_codon:yes stop_codon:yes gene_type:complete
MDEKIIKNYESKKDEINLDKLIDENKSYELMDESIFDKTLKEIDQILNRLEQKSEINQKQLEKLRVLPEIKSALSKFNLAKNEITEKEINLLKNNNLLNRIEDLEKNINSPSKQIYFSNDSNKETNSEIKEHKIDESLLSLQEMHDFKENDQRKKKKYFGFYSYLVMSIIIFLTIYGVLNISKDLIISKYPISEPYINYFYEIIEIFEIIIFGISGFIRNIL